MANPTNSAQLGGIPYHSPKLHPGLCSSVGMRPRTDVHTQTRVTNIHFASSTTHAKEPADISRSGYVVIAMRLTINNRPIGNRRSHFPSLPSQPIPFATNAAARE